MVAKVLVVAITYFFEGAPGAGALPALDGGSQLLSIVLINKESIKVVEDCSRIQDSKVRANIVQLVDTIAASAK
ncbi:MAG: hypothetical protein AAGA50_09950 [Pseudomonadota bacterium]